MRKLTKTGLKKMLIEANETELNKIFFQLSGYEINEQIKDILWDFQRSFFKYTQIPSLSIIIRTMDLLNVEETLTQSFWNNFFKRYIKGIETAIFYYKEKVKNEEYVPIYFSNILIDKMKKYKNEDFFDALKHSYTDILNDMFTDKLPIITDNGKIYLSELFNNIKQ